MLDPLCLAGVTINAESRVSVVEGPAAKELVEQGWRTFLVKVSNQAGITAELKAEGPNLLPMVKPGTGVPDPKIVITPADAADRWLDCARYSAEAARVTGPAVIEGHTATTWVPPGWAAELDKADNLILRRSA